MKILSAITLLSAVLIFSACGDDGRSGSAYVAVDWDWYVDAYNDDNPGLPTTVSRNYDYPSKVGTYNCEYACSDGTGDEWYWQYQYTVSVNVGKPGKTFKDGADGKDRHHKLFLNGLSQALFTVTEKGTASKKKVKKELTLFGLPAGHTKIYHGEPVTEEFIRDGYRIVTTRRMFTLK